MARTVLTAPRGGFRVFPRVGIRNAVLPDSEDEIKAALRQLTRKTRVLRHELEELIRHPAGAEPRAFSHDRTYALRRQDPNKPPAKSRPRKG